MSRSGSMKNIGARTHLESIAAIKDRFHEGDYEDDGSSIE